MTDSFFYQDCLGVVLAGGKSSRMGTSKALLMRSSSRSDGQSSSQENMLSYSKKLLKNIGIEKVVVSGDIEGEPTNNNVLDEFAELGPMGGIYSVIKKYQPKSLLILPVDLPLMTSQSLAELRLKGELSNKATYFRDSNRQAHHIPLYLPNNALLQLFLQQAFMPENIDSRVEHNKENAKNGPSVRGMLQQVPHQAITCSNSNTLFNTNTPQEWQQAQKQF